MWTCSGASRPRCELTGYLVVMDQFTRRIVGVWRAGRCRRRYRPLPNVQPRDSRATAGFPNTSVPTTIPFIGFGKWQANLRILEVTEIKTVPYVPLSHPFVERLIGTLRRECLDRTLFWTTADLESKLLDFKTYFNHHRTHSARVGRPPDDAAPRLVANLQS